MQEQNSKGYTRKLRLDDALVTFNLERKLLLKLKLALKLLLLPVVRVCTFSSLHKLAFFAQHDELRGASASASKSASASASLI